MSEEPNSVAWERAEKFSFFAMEWLSPLFNSLFIHN